MSEPRLVTRWDLDKTYLRTEFDSLRDLVRTAFEQPHEKRAVPGASTVLRELADAGARVHILSGSPRQMKGALTAKLQLDGVRWDELTLKPNLSNALRLRLRALRDQLGYKLPALLATRLGEEATRGGRPPPPEVLVGDDAEADAFVYSLYADVAAGVVDAAQLRKIARAGKLYSDQQRALLEALPRLPRVATVQRVLIHLDRQSPPSHFHDYGPRVVPFYNYLQAAFVLAEDGWIDAAAVLRTAQHFAQTHRFDADALARSYLDLLRREHVTGALAAPLAAELDRWRPRAPENLDLLERTVEGIAHHAASPPEPRRRASPGLDYVALARRHAGGKNRREARH